MNSSVALECWYQALEQPVGLAVIVEADDGRVTEGDRRWLERELYAARKASGDPLLEQLILMKPPKLEELWICRKDADQH